MAAIASMPRCQQASGVSPPSRSAGAPDLAHDSLGRDALTGQVDLGDHLAQHRLACRRQPGATPPARRAARQQGGQRPVRLPTPSYQPMDLPHGQAQIARHGSNPVTRAFRQMSERTDHRRAALGLPPFHIADQRKIGRCAGQAVTRPSIRHMLPPTSRDRRTMTTASTESDNDYDRTNAAKLMALLSATSRSDSGGRCRASGCREACSAPSRCPPRCATASSRPPVVAPPSPSGSTVSKPSARGVAQQASRPETPGGKSPPWLRSVNVTSP